ncbi:MAG: hypothetical protein ACK5LO_06705 [Leucobacter sp.]
MANLADLRRDLRAASLKAQEAAYAARDSRLKVSADSDAVDTSALQGSTATPSESRNLFSRMLELGRSDDAAEVARKAEAFEAEKKHAEAVEKEEREKEAAVAAELSATAKKENEEYLTKIGRRTFRWSLGVIIVVLVAGVFLRFEAGGVKRVQPGAVWSDIWAGRAPLAIAAAAALALWLVLSALSVLKQKDGGLVRMLIGADGRMSTSYFQAWVWTLTLVWALLFFVLLTFTGRGFAEIAGDDGGIPLNADYLLLLGGPFAALVVVRQIDQSKIANQELQKPIASTTDVTDLFSSDSGRADLVDMQYLLFNVVALLVFCSELWKDQSRLPDIPDAIMMLTSGAALGYIARKAVQGDKPTVTSVIPEPGGQALITGSTVLVQGANFIPAGADYTESLLAVRVKFDAQTVSPKLESRGEEEKEGTAPKKDRPAPSLRLDGVTSDAIRVEIPDLSADGLTERMVNVSVVTAATLETDPFPIRILSPVLKVRLEPVTVESGIAKIVLTLLDSDMSEMPVRITVGRVSFDTFWIKNRATVLMNSPAADSSELAVTCGGAVFRAAVPIPRDSASQR